MLVSVQDNKNSSSIAITDPKRKHNTKIKRKKEHKNLLESNNTHIHTSSD
jgi:hypothetical protein